MHLSSRFFIPYIYVCALWLLLGACAQMIPLSGGEKDEQPPVIKKQEPENKSTSFSGNEIKIEFDEYIQVKDLQNQLIITPRVNEEPDVSVSGKTLLLRFKQSLQSNTTYNVNFGGSIADVKEGNVLSGLNVVFSTGAVLDSLSVSGKITDAFTLKPLADCSVFLYLNGGDSCMFKQKPDYFSKTDNSGNYAVNYLRSGTYKVIALQDKNRNYFYDPGDESVAPLLNENKSDLVLNANAQADFSAFKEPPARFFVKRTLYPEYGKTVFAFNKPADSMSVEFTYNPEQRARALFSEKKDSLYVWYKKGREDSIGLVLKEKGIAQQHLSVSTQSEEKYEKDFKLKRLFPELKRINGINEAEIRSLGFDMPIAKADAGKILFVTEKDTARIKEALSVSGQQITWKSAFTKAGKSKLILLPGAVEGFNELSNDSLVYPFQVLSKEETAMLNINLQLPDEGLYRLQLVNEKGETALFTCTMNADKKTLLHLERLTAGNYTLRVWKDEDKNGEWSSGSLLKKETAEKIWYYDKPVKLLADWEVGVDWKL